MTKWVYAFGAELAEGRGDEKSAGGKAPISPKWPRSACRFPRLHHHDGSLHLLLQPRKDVSRGAAGRGRSSARQRRAAGRASVRRRRESLLVSVRSGARASMPGMMDTVLNLGLEDQSVLTLAKTSATRVSPTTAIAASFRCIRTWCLRSRATFRGHPRGFQGSQGPDARHRPFRRRLARGHRGLQEAGRRADGSAIPAEPKDSSGRGRRGVSSWMNARAITYRRLNNIPAEWGTAVNVQAMVFGNMGETSATGVAFTRQSLDRRQRSSMANSSSTPRARRRRRHPQRRRTSRRSRARPPAPTGPRWRRSSRRCSSNSSRRRNC